MNRNLMTPAKTDFLKLLACISMFIDHIGAVLAPILPSYSVVIFLRIIGRIAFPIFAYQAAVAAYNTQNIKKYILRLIIFALVSQIPFQLAIGQGLSIGCTLLLGVLSIRIYKACAAKGNIQYAVISALAVIILAAAAEITHCDYGAYGVIIIFAFYALAHNVWLSAAAQVILLAGYLFTKFNIISVYAILGFIFVYIQLFGVKYPKLFLSKYFFYIFYPAHLLLLYLILEISRYIY